MTLSTIPLPALEAVPQASLRDLQVGSRLEWLEADGRGGYAAGTAVGANTRRHHGLLVVARQDPADRVVLLSRIEETLVLEDGARHDLAVNFYPGSVHPNGHLLLEGFALDPWPVWRYRAGPLQLVKELFVSRLARATVLRYQVRGGAARLELRPLIAGRDFDDLCRATDAIQQQVEASEGLVAYRSRDDIPPLVLSFSDGDWEDSGVWYYRNVYPRETEQGLDDREDLYAPGVLRLPLGSDQPTVLTCGVGSARVANASWWLTEELKRRGTAADAGRRTARSHSRLGELAARLGLAADAFLVERDGGTSIMAGYPWFGDRARDAMISLHGLCLATGRVEKAIAVLRTFTRRLRDGLLPQRIPDHAGDIAHEHYGAADASLWFIETVARVRDAGGAVEEFTGAVAEILTAYERGTHFGIRLDRDGLLIQDEPGIALTWMDSRAGDRFAVRRAGKAVEINALWFNALARAATLTTDAALSEHWAALADRCATAFDRFWFEQGGYLFDVIDAAGRPDTALRPNQLFAVCLPRSPLDPHRARLVIEAVDRELVVPLGVRTLASGDPDYTGDVEGVRGLTGGYHNGAAWPWLFGAFATGYLRVHANSAAARDRIERLLLEFDAHLGEHGLGHIAEVVAGDPPHAPAGCFAHAAACAELLRVIHALA